MAVVNVKESWSGKGLGRSKDGRTAAAAFTVLLDAIPTDLGEVLGASGIPRIGDGYPGDEWLRVSNVGNARAIGPMLFEVPVTYEREGDGDQDSPLDAAPDIRWDTVSSTEAKDFDANGDAITNSAGVPFDPPLTFEVNDRRLSYSRNEASYDPVAAGEFDNVTNGDEFLGWPPGTVLCKPITGDSKHEGELWYSHTRYEFIFRKGIEEKNGVGGPEKAWYRRVLDQGLGELDDPAVLNGKPNLKAIKENVDGHAVEVSSPRLLDGKGHQLDAAADPHWIEIQQYGTKDFAVLNIEIR